MARTQRFGLNFFGGDVPGSLGDDGGKFTNRDRRVLDRILAAFEAHRHEGGQRLAAPAEAPGVVLATQGGQLPAGAELFYRVAYVDQYGLETAASPEASVVTPDPVAPPDGAILEAEEGGTLEDGLHEYFLTSVADGIETPPGPSNTVTLSDRRSVRLYLVAEEGSDPWPEGADEIHVWRQGPVDSAATMIGAWFPSEDTFLDDGSVESNPCPCDPLSRPPFENRTRATSQVTVTIPAPGQGVRRWRVYRSRSSGSFSGRSLVAEIAETAEEGGGALVSEVVDTGESQLLSGQPLESDQTLTPSAELGAGGGGVGLAPLLLDSGEGIWRVIAGLDGGLVTRESGAVAVPGRIILTSQDGTAYEVSVEVDGALATESPEDDLGATIYPWGLGPYLPTEHPLTLFQLGVADDGALTTLEV